MPKINVVSLDAPTEDTTDPVAAYKRRQELARALQKTATTDDKVYSHAHGLAKVAAAGLGAWLGKKAEDDEREADRQDGEAIATGLDAYGRSLGGGHSSSSSSSAPRYAAGGTTLADDSPGDYRKSLVAQEAGGNLYAKNPNSSAFGPFQFTKGTFADTVRRNPELAGARFEDPRTHGPVEAAFRRQNTTALAQAGIEPTDANLYMTHFLGERGGPRFLAALQRNPNLPAVTLVDPAAAAANRSVFYDQSGRPRTAQEVFDLQTRRFTKTASIDPQATISEAATGAPAVPAPGAQRAAELAAQKVPELSAGSPQAPVQVAQAGPPQMTPEIRRLITNKRTRQYGLQLWNAQVQQWQAIELKREEWKREDSKPVVVSRDSRLVRDGKVIVDAEAPDQWELQTLEDGSKVIRNKRNGDTKMVDKSGLLTPAELQQKIQLATAGRSQTTINNGGGSDKQVFDAVKESADAARAAATGLTSLQEARKAVEGGGVFGAGAEARLGLQKLGAAFGVADPKTLQSIQNTETFRAAIAPQVAAMMKATVGSTQISNADREFAMAAAGGAISLEPASIQRLLDIMERGNLALLDAHQSRVDAVYPDPEAYKRERALFGVQAPAGAPVRVKTPEEAKKLPKGTRIMLPDGSFGVVP